MSGISTKILTGFYVTFTAMLMLSVGGCRKTQIVYPHEPYEVRFSVVSAVKPPQGLSSRAKTDENNDFTLGGQMGVYATKSGEEDVSLSLPENSNVGYGNPTGSTQWSVIEAGTAIRFLADNEYMNFYAYHPFTSQPSTSVALSTTDISPTLIYTLPKNQSTLQSLTSADLMWGRKGNVCEEDGVVNLEFEHKLAKISFKVTLGEGWVDEAVALTNLEIVGSKMSETGKLHISSGVFTAGTQSSTAVYCNFNPTLVLDTNNAQECQFIVLPTDLTQLELRVTTLGSKSGTKSYVTTLSSVALPAGHWRQLTMKIHKENSLYVSLSANIAPWEVISDIGMEAI